MSSKNRRAQNNTFIILGELTSMFWPVGALISAAFSIAGVYALRVIRGVLNGDSAVSKALSGTWVEYFLYLGPLLLLIASSAFAFKSYNACMRNRG